MSYEKIIKESEEFEKMDKDLYFIWKNSKHKDQKIFLNYLKSLIEVSEMYNNLKV
jgi:hypothetical protein